MQMPSHAVIHHLRQQLLLCYHNSPQLILGRLRKQTSRYHQCSMQGSPLPLSLMPHAGRCTHSVDTSSCGSNCRLSKDASARNTSELSKWKLCLSQSSPIAFTWRHTIVPVTHRQRSSKALNARSSDSRQEAYWVNMNTNVEKHCKECTVCQQSK